MHSDRVQNRLSQHANDSRVWEYPQQKRLASWKFRQADVNTQLFLDGRPALLAYRPYRHYVAMAATDAHSESKLCT